MLAFNGQAAYLRPDEPARQKVLVHNLDNEAVLATVPIAPLSSMDLLPLDAIETSEGTAIFVGGAKQVPEGELAVTSSFWMIQVDRTGRFGTPTSLTLPGTYSWEANFAIVGDHVIALLDVPDDPDPDAPRKPADSNLVVLDRTGNVVRSLRDKGLYSPFPIGTSAFGVYQTLEPGKETLRVFHLARRDWVGPAFAPGHRIVDDISIGGHAVLVGYPPDPKLESSGDAMTTDRPLFVASLEPSGELSAWKSLDMKGHGGRLLHDVDRSIALLVAGENHDRDRGSELRITAIGPDLSFTHSKSSGVIGYGFGFTSLVLPDSIFVTRERLACTR